MALIIVESPTKARTFNYLLKGPASASSYAKASKDKKASAGKKEYFVFASMGHVRDLPKKNLSIDYKNDFKPDYQLIKNKEKVISQLKELMKKNKEVIVATDPDREGESIGYHVAYSLGFIDEKWPEIFLKKNTSLKRIVFHEITGRALEEALENPSSIRLDLVKAQFARRILDRIVGYELSPLLWKKMGKNWLSAGRVQTVALRLIVEREKEINSFKIDDYYQVYGEFKSTLTNEETSSRREQTESSNEIISSSNSPPPHNFSVIKSKLISKDNLAYEQKNDLTLFAGSYTYTKTSINKDNLEPLIKDLEADSFLVNDITETRQKRYPPPPFTTSLLQQDAFYKLGFSSYRTMKIAQQLYERGLITYHRTDSFNLASSFVFKAKDYIKKQFGEKYALEKPRGYKTRSKSAQEAHEAIRPTKFEKNIPSKMKLASDHQKLYGIIFNRAVATQMKEAEINLIKINVLSEKKYLFESIKEQVIFDGFFKILNPKFAQSSKEKPNLNKGDRVRLVKLTSEPSQTKPPPRYNEASLIKILEEKGIGRPSTYAMIISLIITKNYTEKEGRYFVPTPIGTSISDYLSSSFADIFDLSYTANMEENLDRIASNDKNFLEVLKDFYQPFKQELELRKKDGTVINIEQKSEGICPLDGGKLIKRFSRFGMFIACSNYPKCRYTKSIVKAVKGKKCPKCEGDIVVKYSKKKKRFYGCSNYPKCDFSAWRLAEINNPINTNKPINQ